MTYNHTMVKIQLIPTGFLVFILACPPGSFAQSYQWTDKNGTVHFTDDPQKVPPSQRKKTQKPPSRQTSSEKTPTRRSKIQAEIPGSEEKLPVNPPEAPQNRPIQTKENTQTLTLESGQKAWRSELAKARKAVIEIEKECEKLSRQRDLNQQKSLLFARPIDRQNTQEANTALQDCNERLKQARRYLDESLPEKARKAGVPPGWLR